MYGATTAMTIDFATLDYGKQLRRAGMRPAEKLVHNILRAGDASVGALIELAADTALLSAEEPESFAPLHALRLLGELRPPRMIEPVLRAYGEQPEYMDTSEELWRTEVPQILGRLGAAGVEQLWAAADDPSYTMDQRSTALSALVYATAAAPELREGVVAGARERLAAADDKQLTAHLIATLATLGVSEVYQEVMARYRAGQVDLDIISAAQARQLLLTPNPNRLRCVLHPLWERYEEHGPFPERPNP